MLCVVIWRTWQKWPYPCSLISKSATMNYQVEPLSSIHHSYQSDSAERLYASLAKGIVIKRKSIEDANSMISKAACTGKQLCGVLMVWVPTAAAAHSVRPPLLLPYMCTYMRTDNGVSILLRSSCLCRGGRKGSERESTASIKTNKWRSL